LADWRAFTAFTARVGLQSLPASAETVGLFVTARLADGRKPSTVTRQVAAIARIHREHGFPGPSTDQARAILRGARRLHPQAEEQMKPLTLADVRAIGMELARQDTPIALRDRAIVLVGFASALRSANLVALLLEDVEFVEEGVRLTIRKEKQDQEGKLRRWVGIPHGRHPENCPVAALRDWIARRGSFPGPLFTRFDNQHVGQALQPERICQLVQAALRRIGRDPRGYGSHSMRAGFVTEAGLAGASDLLIATQTGHHDMQVLRRYFRRQDVFRSNVCGLLDL